MLSRVLSLCLTAKIFFYNLNKKLQFSKIVFARPRCDLSHGRWAGRGRKHETAGFSPTQIPEVALS